MIVPAPLCCVECQPCGNSTIAEPSCKTNFVIGPTDALPPAPDSPPDPAAPAPPGCHEANSVFNMGLIEVPNRLASSESRAASTPPCAPGAAISIPAICMLSCLRFTRVKNTASEFVPRTLNTLPTCGRSPYWLCSERKIDPIASAGEFAPSTAPYNICPPFGPSLRVSCARAVVPLIHKATTATAAHSNPLPRLVISFFSRGLSENWLSSRLNRLPAHPRQKIEYD